MASTYGSYIFHIVIYISFLRSDQNVFQNTCMSRAFQLLHVLNNTWYDQSFFISLFLTILDGFVSNILLWI